MRNMIEIERGFTSGVYPKREVAIVRGEGVYIYDSEGRRYIDCVGGIGSVNLGHCNEYVVNAVREQCGKLITCIEIFYNAGIERVIRKIVAQTPGQFVRNNIDRVPRFVMVFKKFITVLINIFVEIMIGEVQGEIDLQPF